MGSEQLKIIYRHGTLGVKFALQGIRAVLASHGVPLTGFTLDDEPASLPSVLSRLERSKLRMFDLVGQGFEFLLGSVGNYHLDFLQIKSLGEPSIPWDEWVAQFIGSPHFVMAWVVE